MPADIRILSMIIKPYLHVPIILKITNTRPGVPLDWGEFCVSFRGTHGVPVLCFPLQPYAENFERRSGRPYVQHEL